MGTTLVCISIFLTLIWKKDTNSVEAGRGHHEVIRECRPSGNQVGLRRVLSPTQLGVSRVWHGRSEEEQGSLCPDLGSL